MDKPYLLIAGWYHYPEARTGNWKGTYSTYEEAVKALKNIEYDWYEIVDLRKWTQ